MVRPPAKLTVVKPLQERIDDCMTEIRSGVASRPIDLQNKYELSRGIVRGLIDEYALPGSRIKLRRERKTPTIVQASLPLLAPLPLSEPAPDPPKPRSSIIPALIAVFVGAVALIFSGVGMVLNYQFASSFGQGLVSYLFGAFGIGIDAGTTLLPSVASHLAEKRKYMQSGLAVALYLVVVLLTALASTGFWATNVGNSFLAIASVQEHRKDLERQRDEATADLAKARHDKPLKDAVLDELDRAIQAARYSIPPSRLQSTQDCTPSLVTSSFVFCDPLIQLRARKPDAERAAENVAKQIADLPAKIAHLSDDIAAIPAFACQDCGAEQIGKITGGHVGTEWIQLFRIFASVLVLSFAPGLLLGFAWSLWS